VISALVRAWRLTKRPSLLELLKNSTKVFELDVENSGVRVPLDGHALYTEIPGGPPPGILDGFMTSLLGLYDLHLETGDPVAGRLFEKGELRTEVRPASLTGRSGVGTVAAPI
jgi:hypothetical protein